MARDTQIKIMLPDRAAGFYRWRLLNNGMMVWEKIPGLGILFMPSAARVFEIWKPGDPSQIEQGARPERGFRPRIVV
jgi:hypothetical protein